MIGWVKCLVDSMADEIRQAPFNMALNTLESIREWIDNIAKLSIGVVAGERVDLNEMIIIKQRMVKQLIMLCTPLLESKDKEEIDTFFKEIRCKTTRIKINGIWRDNVPVYSQEVDYKLDECIEGIEFSLQESGHFMPSPDESSLF